MLAGYCVAFSNMPIHSSYLYLTALEVRSELRTIHFRRQQSYSLAEIVT